MADKKSDYPVSVKLAFLVDSVSVPGSAINNDLTLSDKKQPGIKLSYDGYNLLAAIGGKKVLIPGANIRGMELE